MEFEINIPGKNPSQVKKLNLSNKGLTKFPTEIFRFKNLTKLILSHNHIKNIPKEIGSLIHLRVLDISYNDITVLHAPLFKLPKLHTLVVSHNQIKSIPSQIYESHITVLIADHNCLNEFSLNIFQQVKKLNLAYNLLADIRVNDTLPNLEELWLTGNEIESLSIERQYLPRIKRHYLPEPISQGKNRDSETDELNKNKMKETEGKTKKKIFISYSHKDAQWLEKIDPHFKAFQNEGADVDFWDDRKIKAGDDWEKEIEKALQRASAAVLLISAHYLASDFIVNNELPPLLEKAKEDGTHILPIIIKPCRYTHSALKRFQALNDPQKTLSECTEAEVERLFVKLVDVIEDKFKE